MARRRPNAIDVSFPEEAARAAAAAVAAEEVARSSSAGASSTANVSRSSSALSTTSSLGKRKSDADEAPRKPKRKQKELPKSVYYRKREGEVTENEDLVIDGEDPDENEDEDEDGAKKPIRELDEFMIFDPRHGYELVSLDALEQEDGVDREFEAVGRVKATFENDEDEGQEDEAEEEDGTATKPPLVRLGAILRYTFDYKTDKDPFYIETQYAWYKLVKPDEKYEKFFEHFYTPRRIAQMVICWALKRPKDGYETFLREFSRRVDMFGRTYQVQDLSDSIPEIQDAICNDEAEREINNVSFVRKLLRNAPASTGKPRSMSRDGPRDKHLPQNRASVGNPDLSVLKPENQNSTHVTPRIADLAQGLFREGIEVVGPPPPPVDKVQVDGAKRRTFERLRVFYASAKKEKKLIDYRKEDRVGQHLDRFYKAAKVEGRVYNIGDVVLMPRLRVAKHKDLVPAIGERIDAYFWFGRVLYFVMESQTVHIQWFYHGSNTIMGELAHPQELFLSHECENRNMNEIIGKVAVTMFPGPTVNIKPDDYFCKFLFNSKECTFTSIDAKRLELFESQVPPENCLPCALATEQEHLVHPLVLKNEHGHVHGVALGGKQYHLEDFVLYKATAGPAHIGYITHLEFGKKTTLITVRKVGRIRDLEKVAPEKVVLDERHLYLTREKEVIKAEVLVKVIYAPCMQSFEAPHATLEDWLKLSYNNFYLRYVFPSLAVKSWNDRKKLTWQELYVCTPCCKDRLKGRKFMYDFLQQSEKRSLATLDLFGGVGAFSRGLAEGSGCMTVTHAIEISPSAAKTFMRNSPHTVVYNQCANMMLRYAIKKHERQQTKVPKQLYDEKNRTEVPAPPKPGEIKVITAGFPCQSHSSLNMFVKPDDIKSNLILTTLSYMDFYSPIFAYFENVPGFIRFHLQAQKDKNRHNASGQIDQGGMKLLVRALIDMKYQVRFAFLEAAHYGTPQRRVRFFLVAAKDGHPLPELPQPTHDYPDAKEHLIKYRDEDDTEVRADVIQPSKGIAAHHFVTIDDAIGDLPRFDWAHPRPQSENTARREERRQRSLQVPSKECKKSDVYCGFNGLVGYFKEPRTAFQYHARLEATTNIQQYTKCLLPKKVERVLNIPLLANADYRDLPANQLEWGIADPMSSVARKNYRRGIYGRLNGKGIFPTTVTNVDPTAKQSQVLHPHCHRMVTVRELARSQGFPDSFVFLSVDRDVNVVTMHRQIGNAVPLPLGHALGRELRRSLFHKWNNQREEALARSRDAIVIDDDEDEDGNRHHLQIPAVSDSDDSMDIY